MYFGAEFMGSYTVHPSCHDYNMDASCNAADLAMFGAAFKGGFLCPP
jgi:hypothetical protein